MARLCFGNASEFYRDTPSTSTTTLLTPPTYSLSIPSPSKSRWVVGSVTWASSQALSRHLLIALPGVKASTQLFSTSGGVGVYIIIAYNGCNQACPSINHHPYFLGMPLDTRIICQPCRLFRSPGSFV